MIRKTTLLAGALALTLVASQAHAAVGDWMLGLHGGTAIPSGDYGDFARLGFMGGVSIGYAVSENLCVGIDGSFIANGAKGEINDALTAAATFIEGTPTTVEAKVNFLQGGAHAKHMFPMQDSNIAPYAVIGAGLYNVKSKRESPNPGYAADDSETKLGGRGGLGLNFKAGEAVSVGVEGGYHYISTETTSTRFIGVQAGVTISLSTPR